MVVLVNGEPTNFFKMSRGLRQGCDLSPLLFILVMDSFSREIQAMKEARKIKGCGITRNTRLSHLLFIDDILRTGVEKLSEWEAFHKIFHDFHKASGLYTNIIKSELLSNGGETTYIIDIADLFGVKIRPLSQGFIYLGRFLKPNKYKIVDWDWLIAKFENSLLK